MSFPLVKGPVSGNGQAFCGMGATLIGSQVPLLVGEAILVVVEES